ncbi:MAG: hypothetical protein R3Y53_02025 [Bacillota bacterium]
MCILNKRKELQAVLEDILGSRNVYYQPPASIKMNYPAIVYTRDKINNQFANNHVYHQTYAYQVTVIDKNPDSSIVEKISLLNTCKHVQHYHADNLNHDVFTIYF